MKTTFLKSSIVASLILGNIAYAQNIVKNGSFEDGPALCTPNNQGPFYLGQGYASNWTSVNPANSGTYPLNTASIYQNAATCTYGQFSSGFSANHGNRSVSIFMSNSTAHGLSDSRAIGEFTTGTIGSGTYKICLAALGGIYLTEPNGRNTLQVYLVKQGTTTEKLISEFNIPKNSAAALLPWGNYGNSFTIAANEAGIYDRVVLRIKTPPSNISYYTELVYIDNVIIGRVNSTSSPCDGTYDLAAFDNNTDIGAEPYDPGSNWQIWQSKDIWSRATDAGSVSGNLVAENVDNSTNHNNLVRFRVKNIGVSASNPSHAKLYWTVGTTGGEPWPAAWTGGTHGGEIIEAYPTPNSNASQIPHVGNGNNSTTPTTYTPGQGFNIPALQPGEEYIVNALWMPSASGIPNTNTPYPQICYLARIVDSNDPMYDERTSTSTFTFNDNVKSNNNIVTRNSTFVPLSGGGVYYRGTGTIFFSNSTDRDNKFDFAVRDVSNTGGTPFSDLGDVLLTLDKELFDRWIAGGSQAEGIEMSNWEKRELRVTDINNAKLRNITLKADEYRAVALSFELSQDTDIVEDYHFAAFQNLSETPDEEYGTVCNFIVSVNGAQQDPGQSFCEGDGNCDDGDGSATTMASVFKGDISLSPNPSSDQSVLEFALNKDTELNVELLDTFGKPVKTVVKSKDFRQGDQSIDIDISDLESGVYRVLMYTSSERKLINLIKR